jgi:hypothetical protein
MEQESGSRRFWSRETQAIRASASRVSLVVRGRAWDMAIRREVSEKEIAPDLSTNYQIKRDPGGFGVQMRTGRYLFDVGLAG